MALGFLFAALTGLSWTAIGVVLSRCAKQRFDIVSYSMVQTAATAVLAFLLYAEPGKVELRTFWILAAAVFGAGALNALAQMVVKTAMTRGNHGPIWTVSQSALVVPFLASVILWGKHGTAGQWTGTALIAGGILIPVAGKCEDFRLWLRPALLAILLFGIVQTLYLVPSQFPECRDAGNLRPMLAAFGGLTGWELVRRGVRGRFLGDRPTLVLALFMSVLSLVGLKLFFLSLDHLARAGFGNVGIPLIVGCNIVGFSLYSLLILRERLSRIEISGMLAILAGIAAIAIN